MTHVEAGMRKRMAAAVGIAADPVETTGPATLSHAYPVSALAASAIATAARSAAELVAALGSPMPSASVHRPLADAWFGVAVRPEGWEPPSPWDAVAGDYRTVDGWIRLHTNAPHHRTAALRVLGVAAERDEVASAVAVWRAHELEDAVVAEGGCAAVLRSPEEWAAHPAGAAVAGEPLVAVAELPAAPGADASTTWRPTADRPLAGLRVLDLTRVLAGPVATRLLAGLGADVLRIDAPGWEEPALEPDMTLGKRCARLDARDPAGLESLLDLLAASDVLVHGYRGGALAGLGLDDEVRSRTRPGLVDVSLTAYGHTGPWASRRGFDSLVQMSTGIAAPVGGGDGMREGAERTPTPLPVQALDHATGYLMAAAVLAGLTRRVGTGTGTRARLSLARTALELTSAAAGAADPASASGEAPLGESAPSRRPLDTPWGPATVLPPPFELDGVDLGWDRPPRPLGSDPATW